MNMELLELLRKYGGTEETVGRLEEYGVETAADILELEAGHLVQAGMKLVQANRLLKEVRQTYEEKPEEQPLKQEITANETMRQVMAIPLDDDSLLDAIKMKNELRVDDQAYIAAMRADLADRAGLLDVPGKLNNEMLAYAEKNDRPVDNMYFDVQALMMARDYSVLFAGLPNGSRRAVSKTQKKGLLAKMQEFFWPAVFSAYLEILRWRQIWVESATPGAAMAYLTQQKGIVPPGIGMAPDVGPLRDAAEKLRIAMNKTLSGLKMMAADALFYDCTKVKDVLLTEGLPELIGALDYDQMLTMLEVNIDESIVRTEQNLVRFVLGMIKSKDVGSDEEADYFSALYTIGYQVNWQLIGFRTDELENLRNKVADLNVILAKPRILQAEMPSEISLEILDEDVDEQMILPGPATGTEGIPRLGDIR